MDAAAGAAEVEFEGTAAGAVVAISAGAFVTAEVVFEAMGADWVGVVAVGAAGAVVGAGPATGEFCAKLGLPVAGAVVTVSPGALVTAEVVFEAMGADWVGVVAVGAAGAVVGAGPATGEFGAELGLPPTGAVVTVPVAPVVGAVVPAATGAEVATGTGAEEIAAGLVVEGLTGVEIGATDDGAWGATGEIGGEGIKLLGDCTGATGAIGGEGIKLLGDCTGATGEIGGEVIETGGGVGAIRTVGVYSTVVRKERPDVFLNKIQTHAITYQM